MDVTLNRQAKQQIDELIKELREADQRVKIAIEAIRAAMDIPERWQYDIVRGAFVEPPSNDEPIPDEDQFD